MAIAFGVTALVVALKTGSLVISLGAAVMVIALAALTVGFVEAFVRLVSKKTMTSFAVIALSIVVWICMCSLALFVSALLQDQS